MRQHKPMIFSVALVICKMQYTISELATELKKRYPQYTDMDDQELVNKAILKKPELKNLLKAPEPKKYSVSELATQIKERYPQHADIDDQELVDKAIAKKPELKSILEQPSFFDKTKDIVEKGATAVKAFVSKDDIKEKIKSGIKTGARTVMPVLSLIPEKVPSKELPPEKKPVPRTVENISAKTEPAVQEQTATITDPLLEKKYRAVAESEDAVTAGAKEAALALTYGESPVSKYRYEEHPIASTAGAIGGTVVPMLVGGAGVTKAFTKVPAVMKVASSGKAGRMAVQGISRAAIASADFFVRQNNQLFSDNAKERRTARKNLGINIAASLVSVLPESLLPRNMIQPFAQASADLLTEVVGQKIAGDNAFSKENFKNTVISTITNGLFGLLDMRGTKSAKNVAKKIMQVADESGIKLSEDREKVIRNYIMKSLEQPQTPSESKIGEPEIASRVSDEIDRLNTIVFKSGAMKNVESEMNIKLEKAKKEERIAAQRGWLKLSGEGKTPPGGDAEVVKTLEAGRFESLNPAEKIAIGIKRFTNSIKKNFTKYEADVETFPQYRDDRRTQHNPMRRILFDTVSRYRHATVGTIYKNEGKKGLRRITDLLILRNLKLRGEKGQVLENNLNVKQVTKHLEWLENTSSPEVLAAAEDIKKILNGLGEELVSRGKLKAEVLEEDYFPHKVLEYLPDFMRGLKTPMNRKFGEPYRPYTKKAVGSKRIIASDDSVIWTHVAKVLADNAHEDWILKQANKYDAINRISAKEREKLYHGYETVIDGKRYKALKWKDIKYKARTVNEGMLESAIENDMMVRDWMEMKGPRGGSPTRMVPVTGKPKLYLLPKEIATDLDNLIEKSSPIHDIVYSIGHLTQKWKGMTLTAAMLPYQFGNLIGDGQVATLYDPLSHKYLPNAARISSKIFYENGIGKAVKLTPFEQKVYNVAIGKDVANSGMTSELRRSMFKKGLEAYKTASEYRESLMRISILAHQVDRLEHGKPVQNLAGIDLTGLDDESAAGKVSREVLVDYAAVPRSYQLYLSRGLLPFVRFHEGTFRNLFRSLTRNKGTHKAYKTALPIISSYAAQWAYNNLDKDRKDLEMKLPDYIRNRWHIVLGENEEKKVEVWAPQQPVDMTLSWLGLDNINRISSDLMDGRITPKQAAYDFLAVAKGGAVENIESLLNPVAQAWLGLKTNKDPFTNNQIMPDDIHEEGPFSRYGAKYSVGYLVEKIFTPVMQYNRTKRGTKARKNPYLDWIKEGPLHFKRAVGFYEIDPSTGDLAEHYKTTGPLRASEDYYRSKFYNILDTYGFQVTNALKAKRDGIALTEMQIEALREVKRLNDEAKNNGFSALNYGAWIGNITGQRKMIDSELRRTTNKAERRSLLSQREELLKATQVSNIRQVPVVARERYVKEMKRKGSLPEGE